MPKIKLQADNNKRDAPSLREKFLARKESALENRDIPKLPSFMKRNEKPKREFVQPELDFDPETCMEIDSDNIYEENLRQPSLMSKIAIHYAFWAYRARRLDDEVGKIIFAIGKDIQKNPEKYGLKQDKTVSDALVKRTCYGNSEYLEINAELDYAKSMRDKFEKLVEACKQRSTAIGRAIQDHENAYD